MCLIDLLRVFGRTARVVCMCAVWGTASVEGQVTVVQSFDGVSNPDTSPNPGGVGADPVLAAGVALRRHMHE
jgi:hypothetical protein